jgi:hypothetical protein
MDGYDGAADGAGAPADWEPNAEPWASLRSNLGYIREFAERVDLAAMRPQPELSSTGYCLSHADGGTAEYLVYADASTRTVTVDLSGHPGDLAVEWLDPRTGESRREAAVSGGGPRQLRSPFSADAVLYLRSISRAAPGAGPAMELSNSADH